MQFELFPFDQLSPAELAFVCGQVRSIYWLLRNSRPGYNEARRRRLYRQAAAHKKRLLMAGVKHAEILKLLACCRKGCCRHQCLDCAS